jgi:hypothetical protein
MALPLIQTPRYETRVPSTNARVTYRPYLVKEEKILMLARESADPKQMARAIKDVVASCTFGAVDPDKLSSFDLEFIFLKLASKSVGEVSKITLKCEKCEVPNPIEVNLDEIGVDMSNLPNPRINLTDKIGVVMRWPTMDLIGALSEKGNDHMQEVIMALIAGCIDSIFDENGVYRADDHTPEEIAAFVESLNRSQFAQIQKYVESIPQLHHTVEFDCVKCKEKNSMVIKGLQNFF